VQKHRPIAQHRLCPGRRRNRRLRRRKRKRKRLLHHMPLPIIGAHNISSVACTEEILHLLNKGLKFIPTSIGKDLQSSLLVDFARYERSVRLRCLFGNNINNTNPITENGMWKHAHEFRKGNPDFVPPLADPLVEGYLSELKSTIIETCRQEHSNAYRTHVQQKCKSNLTATERMALQQLREMHDIIIKPADKNLGLTIMDRTWYDAEMMRQLNDPNIYSEVKDEDFPAILIGLQKTLSHLINMWGMLRVLPEKLSDFLLGSLELKAPSHVYLLPKLHKPVLSGRMICPSHSWITTRVSTWLAAELNDTVRGQPTVLQDSRELIRDLEHMLVSRDSLLVTFDVDTLYPNIPHTAARDNIISFFENCAAKKRHAIGDFLDFVMLNNYFQFREKMYRQTHGTAMGTPVAPPYANLFLARLEQNVMHASPVQPAYYKRFIDDGFIIWEGTRVELDAFLTLWAAQYESINITSEISEISVHFLDLNISKDVDNTGDRVPLIITTYEKPLNKYLYIPFSSFHTPHVFKGFIKSRLISYMVTNSRFKDFSAMRDKFVKRLLLRGYPRTFLKKICEGVSYADRLSYLHGTTVKRGTNSVPFITNFTSFNAGFINWRTIFQTVYSKHESAATLKAIMPAPPMVVYYRGKNLQSKLVRADH
jgi:hypothetical protein